MLRHMSSAVFLLCLAVACGESDPGPVPGGSGGSGASGGTGGSGGVGGTGGSGGSVEHCGDGHVQGLEACDDGEANSDEAPDACRTDCTFARCGDGTIDSDETCDDGNTAALDGCDDRCQVEPHCGDGIRNGAEACDGDDISTSCIDLGFVTGAVACTPGCTIDSDACRPAEDCSTPGDEDGDGLFDCEDSDCIGHFECPDCGDGILQRGESCEGPVPDGESCANLGFNSGHLTCTYCRLDPTGCFNVEVCDAEGDEDDNGLADCDDPACAGHFECPACGDGTLQRGEQCDGSIPTGLTCAGYGFNTGTVACTSCQFDSSGCSNVELCGVPGDEDGDGDADCADSDCVDVPPCIPGCGDGIIDPGESCDDGNIMPGDGCSDTCVIEGTPLEAFAGGNIQFSGSLGHPDPQHAYRPGVWCTLNGFGPQYYDLHYVTNTGSGRLNLQVDASWGTGRGALAISEAPYDPTDPVARCIDFNDDDPTSTVRNLLVEPGQTLGIVATTFFVNNSIASYTVTATTIGVCGDATTTYPETCDDGNLFDGDGCNSDCGIPPVIPDVEPNDTTATATPLPEGSIGVGTLAATIYYMPAVDPADVWQIDLAAGSSYVFRTGDSREGTCNIFNLNGDTKLELLDASGTVLATSGNLSDTELCSEITWSATATGTHYLGVTQENFLALPDPIPVRYFLFFETL